MASAGRRTCTTSASGWCRRRSAALALVVAAACAGGDQREPIDTALEGLAITDVQPRVAVHGTTLVVTGDDFVDQPWGTARLRLRGTYAGAAVDVAMTARFADYDRLELTVDPLFATTLGGEEGEFVGEAVVEITSAVDGKTYSSEPLSIALQIRRELTPRLDSVQTGGLIFVNDPIEVVGDGLLLGDAEGTTYAVVQGCFTPDGEVACAPVGPTEIPVVPAESYARDRGSFAFSPAVAGIRPGAFTGTVLLRNDHAQGGLRESAAGSVSYDVIRSTIFAVSTSSASLGQFVDVTGGGFVGGADGATLIRLQGTFDRDGGPTGIPVDMELVPEFVTGTLVRYVVNEEDALGQAIDLRTTTGQFSGTVTPVVSYRGVEVTGDSSSFALRIAPVKQVVWVKFLPSYRESLRHYGLRAVDYRIRERVFDVLRRDYATINVDFRAEEPTDFALYAIVEIAGSDPNGQGLLGYDNTPGKDIGNDRLYDRIGGVNAQTQEDGYPGYGGVFVESLFGFSEHPGAFAAPGNASADPAFDDVFDPFRPDRDGAPVLAADVSAGVEQLSDGSRCPATERADRIACAVFVLGSLIGTTTAHELGHSMGLANPFGEGFHNIGDEANRLMDSGSSRSFLERAELFGEGPSRFCDEEYDYLRQLMPTSEPADASGRPTCF